jgi:ELWxxDGT repeat protein
MKTKILFFALLIIIYTAITVNAQKPVYPKPGGVDNIPFGKKLPPPSLNLRANSGYQNLPGSSYGSFDPVTKSFKLYNPGYLNNGYPPALTLPGNGMSAQSLQAPKPAPYNFHLTKDINTHAQPLSSYPNNTKAYPNHDNFYLSFAVLNNVSYFTADDGIHGAELWRSDGTSEGTFIVKDINPGAASSNPNSIIVANGKIYFSAYTDATSWAPWVSDGTESGTKLIKDIGGVPPNYPEQLVNVNSTIFFTVNSDFGSALWKTDGTPENTFLVYDFNATDQYAGYITEATAANGLYFFSAWTPTYGRELWRSDGTTAGTYLVKDIGPDQSDFYSPLQLTEYNNKLYFSGDDGSGRKLWSSDGTPDGTTNVSGSNDIIVQTDFLDYTFNYPFPVLNNILYLGGNTPADGNGLYKYDASNADGLVLVRDLTSSTDPDFIVPTAFIKVGNALFFKVINSIGGYHDDLWSSDGTTGNTQVVKAFEPGHITNNYYDGYGTLYFLEDDPTYSGELWKSNGTEAGTILVKDINPGNAGSWPAFITPCNGKIQFQATDATHGTELWITDGTDIGTTLVKDINGLVSTNTDGSDAGFFYKGLSSNGNGVLFNAFTPDLGGELYKSDGTTAGTFLLNDINPGPDWSYPNSFLYKNNVTYFIGDDAVNTGFYITNGTPAGLKRITYINRDIFYVVNFNVIDNGLAFYTLGNKFTGALELWRSDGTVAGTYMLTPNLSYYYDNYVVNISNTVFFIAGDFDHGYELWKSDGSITGTKMVKDINPGFNGSYPYSLFVYKKDVYFGAWDGGLNYSLWKSDGTEKGTIKLKSITPAYYYSYFNATPQHIFCVSNSILYFNATDFNAFGAELWKTNGTASGTTLVKDINTYYSSYPDNLTDVNGILYFTADDGVHGNEIWKTNGTTQSTTLVKDIDGYYYNLCSAGGKLYFLNNGTYPYTLWSSDGTAKNTNQVTDAGLNGLSNITNLTPAGNKLFFGAYSYNYGTELYEGDANAGTFAPVTLAATDASAVKINLPAFDAILYPNPTHGAATLQIKGNVKHVGVIITDMAGRVIWKINENNDSQISLPVEKLAAGAYILTVQSGADKKTLKLVKE